MPRQVRRGELLGMSADKPLLVTVFSDASLKDNVAGVGWWFKSSEKQGKGHQQLADFPHDITIAELCGILKAVAAAVQAHPGRKLVIVLQCDNLAALGAVASLGARSASTSPIQIQPRKSLRPQERVYLNGLKDVLGDTLVWLKHVKGHNGNKCKRSAVNSLTDRLSRRGRIGKPS